MINKVRFNLIIQYNDLSPSIAACQGSNLRRFDIKTAFLYGAFMSGFLWNLLKGFPMLPRGFVLIHDIIAYVIENKHLDVEAKNSLSFLRALVFIKYRLIRIFSFMRKMTLQFK